MVEEKDGLGQTEQQGNHVNGRAGRQRPSAEEVQKQKKSKKVQGGKIKDNISRAIERAE